MPKSLSALIVVDVYPTVFTAMSGYFGGTCASL